MPCKIDIFITLYSLCLGLSPVFSSCQTLYNPRPFTERQAILSESSDVIVGAQQLDVLLPMIKDRRIGLVMNQTSVVNQELLLDTLFQLGVDIKVVFAPEHGLRGQADAGARIENERDAKTGIPILSIYGKNKKPTASQLDQVDVLIFDIQDVGARFYTYISTLHYVMEAAAEQGKEVIVLDRPNPNGHYVDGPILEKANQSFVGMDPIPIVHGMTVGEYAQMLNGEKWLAKGVQCDLKVIKVKNYTHKTFYNIPIAPSPNLPNMRSIYLYPSLCLFEGTPYSVGRGTQSQFQVWGHPLSSIQDTSFTPESLPGALTPPLLAQKSFGKSYKNLSVKQLRSFGFSLKPILEAYHSFQGRNFFNSFFVKLAGTAQLQNQIVSGWTEEQVRASWQKDLSQFKKIRKKYLLYPDFDE